MVGIAHLYAEGVPHGLHGPEVDVRKGRGVLRVAVEQADVGGSVFPEHPEGRFDLIHLAHSRGHHHRPSGFRQRFQIGQIRDLAGGDLPEGDAQLVKESGAFQIKGRGEEGDAHLLAVLLQA